MLRKINISAAAIVLVCFFLPWVQVSCAGARDTLSGFDLAREESTLLWLVPVMMLAVIAFNLLRAWKEQPRVAGILTAICAAVAALVMNRERLRVNDRAVLISAQLTGWFWLSLIALLGMVAAAMGALVRPRRNI